MDDGRIEYLGRLDNQVKLRGYRIELGEIESCLNQLLGVEQAVVTIAGKTDTDQQLVAYVETTASAVGSIQDNDIRKQLRAKLPAHMVPQHIIAIDKLPLTLNGKINRQQLPEPIAAATHYTPTGISPHTQLEKQVAAIWADLLDLSDVPVNETFFNLGGHSLLAMRVVARLKNELDIDINPVALIDRPILELISEYETESVVGNRSQEKQSSSSLSTLFFDHNQLYLSLIHI